MTALSESLSSPQHTSEQEAAIVVVMNFQVSQENSSLCTSGFVKI